MHAAVAVRLQVDQHAAAVPGDVRAVDPDERGEGLHGRVLQDGVRQRLLSLGHRRERHRLRRLGDSLDDAGVLHWEKAFRHHEIQDDREDQRRRPDEQRGRLAIQYPVERVTVALDHPVEHAARRTREAALALLALGAQEPRAHHRRQGERHHRRDEDRHCERHGELAEQAPDDVAHEKERYQHRNEREGERDDGEADLLRALERGLQRRLAGLDIACDVLDDDDGVVDHEAGGDHQRHQRKVIDRETGEYMTPNVPMSESGTATLGMIVARSFRRKTKITATTKATASSNSICTSCTEARIVTVRSVSTATSRAAGSDACSCGSWRLMRSTTSMTLAPGWRWMLRMIAGTSFIHAARRRFSALSTTSATSERNTGAPLR